MGIYHSSLDIQEILKKIEFFLNEKKCVNKIRSEYRCLTETVIDSELREISHKLWDYIEYSAHYDILDNLLYRIMIRETFIPISIKIKVTNNINLSNAEIKIANLSIAKKLLTEGYYTASKINYEYEVFVIISDINIPNELINALHNAIKKVFDL